MNGEMLIDFIQQVLFREIRKLNVVPQCLVLDKSRIHNVTKIQQALRNGLGSCSIQILVILSQSGKRINPSGNASFHEWKDRIRAHRDLTKENLVETMKDQCFAMTKANIKH